MKQHSTAPWPVTPEPPPGMESETALPARAAGFVSDFLVPAAQSALTGMLLAGLVAFALLELFNLDANPLKLWGGIALGITCLTWLVLLADTRKLLWAIEKLTNLDIDQDGATGEPGAHLVFVNREKAKQEAATARADAEWLLLLGFVSRLGVKGTALATWQKELGRDRYAQFRDALIDYGLARWRSYGADGKPKASQGWDLVGTPEQTLAQLEIERA